MERNAIIIGAGIGGLTAAIALKKQGWTVVVREAAERLLPIGAGLLLQPNAMNALGRLGVARDVRLAGLEIREGWMMTAAGREVQSLDLSFGGRRTAAIGIHRGTLQKVLLGHLDDVEIQLGRRTVPSDLDAHLSGDASLFEGAQLIVGADGVRSAVAEGLFGKLPLDYAGYTCFRGVTSAELDLHKHRLTEYMGAGRRFGVVPLGGGQVYWFATRNARAGTWASPEGSKEALLQLFSKFPRAVQELIAGTESEHVIVGDINDREPLPRWIRGNVCLLGDAAHPMTPNLGQGAGQAIEDAFALSEQLAPTACASEAGIEGALKKYESARLQKSSRIVTMSRRVGQMGQLESPILRLLRDWMYRLTPVSVTEKQVLELVG